MQSRTESGPTKDKTPLESSPSNSDRADPLLATKLFIPPARPNLVARTRLTERLNEGVKGKLTLVSAPAGFGKSTLLAEWSLKTELPVLWVSLDEGDNDPTRFLAYLVLALERLKSGLGENVLALICSPQQPPLESLLAALINEIAREVPTDFALVLDDYHLIEAQPIHDALTFLLEHLPPQMHLVIASRTDPLLPLARFLVRGQLTKLSGADLRFTPEEAAAFLNEIMGLNLSAEDVGELEERTEGWIAGLQLAALSMQGRKDIHGFIEAFAGSHRYVLDYLAEEVLDKQPEDVQEFSLETSILERLSGPLCDAVIGRNDGQKMLEILERANLFLIPLDDERQWYRYHHLFADFLRKRLRQRHPAMEPELHYRASEWYERSGLPSEAVSHALRAQDFERAAGLIERGSLTMLMHGELTTLLGWLDMLPEGLVRSRPRLCLAYAATLLSFGRAEDVEPYLRDAERLLGLDSPAGASTNSLEPAENKEVANLYGVALAIRAFIIYLQEGWHQTIIALAHRALKLLNEDNLFVRSFVVGTLGFAHLIRGDTEAAGQALDEAITIGQTTNAPLTTAAFINELGHLRVIQGRLREAEEIYRQALRFAAEHGEETLFSTTSITHMGIGEVLHEQNDLENAERHLLKGIELYERSVSVHYYTFYGYITLARLKQIQGDTDAVFEAIQKAKQITQQAVNSFFYRRLMKAWQARRWIAQDDLIAAARWAEESDLSSEDELDYPREFEHITLAWLLIAQGDHHEALRLLERLLEAAEAGGRGGSVIEILVLKALALQAQNAAPNALATLQRALSLAEPEGYVRTFVDKSTPMATLRKQLLEAYKAQQRGAAEPEVSLEYVGKLLEALGEDVGVSTKGHARGKAGPLVEPITERELEVLRLLALDLSNREIAKKLYLSLDTVKSHLKHIYGKLGVRSRYQAVDRARELDLLR